jgi:hypothetical protein
MNTFWQHPLGKIISHVVHDSNNASCSMSSAALLIEKEIENKEPDMAKIAKWVDRIKKGIIRQENAVDYGYTKIKEYVNTEN